LKTGTKKSPMFPMPLQAQPASGSRSMGDDELYG
jgi:hypothetical protein